MGKIFDRIHEKVTRKIRERRRAKEHNKALEKIAKEEERDAYDEAFIREKRKVGRKKAVKKAQAGWLGSFGALSSVGSFVMSHPMDTEKVGRAMNGSSAFDLGMGGASKKGKKSALEKELGL